MARAAARPRIRRGTLIKTVAVVAVLGTVGAVAAVAQGYDAHEVPRLETSVWVTRDAGQYARVNTELGEIDTVRAVSDPSGIVQAGSAGLVFGQGFAQLWAIDSATPRDLESAGDPSEGTGEDASAPGTSTPALTRVVSTAGDYVLYLTENGEVYLGRFPDADGTVADPAPLDPFAGVEVAKGAKRPQYVADAAAVDANGRVVTYSSAEKGVRSYDAASGRFQGDVTKLASAPDAGPGLAMTFAGGRWALSSSDDALLWLEGRAEPVDTGLTDGVLQAGASRADRVLLADRDGLSAVDTGDGEVTRLTEASGTPAAPLEIGGVAYAAWVAAADATLWSSDADETRTLAVDAQALDDADTDIAPVFRSNGDRGVLNEPATGMVWTLPDGALVPTEEWDPLDESAHDEGTVQVDDVIEEAPPVAVADSFGVRPGALASLPVLLNDHDPNKDDVLTLDPASLTALSDPGFGTVSLVADDQQLVVDVRATSGSVTFSYAASDGVQSSAPVTVTLTVVPDDQNSAPVWCGVAECVQKWPTPQIAPGGFASIDVLPGWVDPEGDAVSLADAQLEDSTAPVTVVPTDDGHVVIRHQDPNASEAMFIVTVTVADARGATTSMPLEVRVTASPALEVQPVAVSAGVGEQRRVDIADSVSGGSGSYRLIDAVAVQGGGDAFIVAPSGATGTVELSAQQPGEYAASYTVQDTQTLAQRTAVIRYSVQAGERPLAAPPLTAFVRPGEDATVDVLGAVQNTSGRVLLIQDASTSDPGLSVGIVGQSYLRVSGTTPDGLPGRLGVARVVIVDGAGNSTTTQLTVFLLAPSHGIGPIAVPDTVSVRAGNQIDIPVLANDVSPRGERLLLHPQLEASGAEGELAFANGSTVRYLAPDLPGSYTVRYSAYLENDPARVDSALLTVNVLPPGTNRAPQPSILSARVLAGQSVTIPIPQGGLDPDGDSVVLSDVDQPDAGAGVASITAAGDAIVYRAPAGGVRGGQLSFGYTVRDPDGAEGQGVVRIGVLASEVSDVAPVTYSDYVGVQRGSAARVTIEPLLNDRDPLQGGLELIKLVPNAPENSTEYARLAALIDPATALDDGTVVLTAGDIEGTNSYVYTVQSSTSFSTAEGLIVLGVSDAPAPDHPLISDTIVTARTRAELAKGIDVVSGKVQWPTGDVGALKLSLWGAPKGFSVVGSRIAGELPKQGAVVPFALTGADASGGKVVSYGFLRIPSFDDMRVQLKPDVTPIPVDEEKSVDVSVSSLLDLAAGDSVEIRQDDAFAVQRANAHCAPSGGGKVQYVTGREAPWSDSCSVAVRISGQSRWSIVAVPFAILPKDPQAILSPASHTVSPGEQVDIDLLKELTSWEGGRVGDTSKLDFTTAFAGTSFEVTTAGGVVTALARADARPGTRETVRVAVSSYGGLSTTITLVVGIAAPDAPKGATFGKQCDVSAGSSCTITAVGLAGEYDPFAGKPGAGLTVASVGTNGSVSCPVATVTRQSASTLVASWPSGSKPIGGECVVAFTVADAQGRTGQGQLTLDVLGYPQTPASIVTDRYTANSVTVRIALGEATQAHPSVTGVALYEDGSKVSAACIPGVASYLCTVDGLTNGSRHSYSARAVNSVGESEGTTPVVTWAYDRPVVTALHAEVIFKRGTTSASQGVVDLDIESTADVQGLKIMVDGMTSTTINRADGDTTSTQLTIPLGAKIIRVVPISKYNPPLAASNEGAEQSIAVTVIGSPSYPGGVTGAASPTSITVASPAMNTAFSTITPVQAWAAWTSGTPSCEMSDSGALQFTANGASDFHISNTATVAELTPNRAYRVGVCGTNGFGAASAFSTGGYLTWQAPGVPTGTLSYTVATTPSHTEGTSSYSYGTASGPAPDAPPADFAISYSLDGSTWSNSFDLDPGRTPSNPQLRYCLIADPSQCGPVAAITAVGAPNEVLLRFPNHCVVFPNADDVRADGAGNNFDVDLTTDPTSYTVTWKNAYAGLASVTHPIDFCLGG